MTAFYRISTSDFKPISSKEIYLYLQYDKITSFLFENKKENLSYALAKPSLKSDEIEWFNIGKKQTKYIDQYNEIDKENILKKYQTFLNEFHKFYNKLLSSSNNEKRNWGTIFKDLIECPDNKLFYDGENIIITWGWKNIKKENKPLIENIEKTYDSNNTDVDYSKDILTEFKHQTPDIIKHQNILDKLYLFFKKIWWITPILSLIILILLLIKCCEKHEAPYEIVNIESIIDSCCSYSDIPTNEERTCIAIIDETSEASQDLINESWRSFRNKWPNRPFYILKPEHQDLYSDTDFYYPDEPKNYETYKVNRDNGDINEISDWFTLTKCDKLPKGSKIAVLIDVPGSMTEQDISASFLVFKTKVKENGLIIVETTYDPSENYIEPFNRDLN